MADYDCDYCSRSIEYGGKCDHFEYNCPFSVVEKYDSEKLKVIRSTIDEISEAIEKLKARDVEYCIRDEIDSILFQLSLLEDKVDEDTEKEWNRICK